MWFLWAVFILLENSSFMCFCVLVLKRGVFFKYFVVPLERVLCMVFVF